MSILNRLPVRKFDTIHDIVTTPNTIRKEIDQISKLLEFQYPSQAQFITLIKGFREKNNVSLYSFQEYMQRYLKEELVQEALFKDILITEKAIGTRLKAMDQLVQVKSHYMIQAIQWALKNVDKIPNDLFFTCVKQAELLPRDLEIGKILLTINHGDYPKTFKNRLWRLMAVHYLEDETPKELFHNYKNSTFGDRITLINVLKKINIKLSKQILNYIAIHDEDQILSMMARNSI